MKYHKLRAKKWEEQGRDTKVNFRNGCMADGNPLDGVYLQPTANLFYKDIWHCPTNAAAKKIVKKLAACPDVKYLELKGQWVWVDWRHGGNVRELPGLSDDDGRERVTG